MAVDINGTTGLTFNNGSTQDVGGVGTGAQTWQNMGGLRSGGVTYTNSTGKPIMVSINQASSGTQNFFINGVLVAQNQTTSVTASGFTFIIPNGANYQSSSAGSFWFELR
jgi:hypothetical protein